MHSLSSSLDAAFQFGLEAQCVRGSLNRVMNIISPSQMNTVNTATATEALYNQGPMYTLWLTHHKADRLNYTKEIWFSLKHTQPKARARQWPHSCCKAPWSWSILHAKHRNYPDTSGPERSCHQELSQNSITWLPDGQCPYPLNYTKFQACGRSCTLWTHYERRLETNTTLYCLVQIMV